MSGKYDHQAKFGVIVETKSDDSAFLKELNLVQAKLNEIARTMQSAFNGINLSKYWKEQTELINDAAAAYQKLISAPSWDTGRAKVAAEEFLKLVNAIKATGANEIDIKIGDVGLKEAIAKVESLRERLKFDPNAIDELFSVQKFREAFELFKQLEANGANVRAIFSNIGAEGVTELERQLKAANDTIQQNERVISDLNAQLDELGHADLESLRTQLETIKQNAAETFEKFLTGSGFDTNLIYNARYNNGQISRYDELGTHMAEMFGEIEAGTKNADQAITEFGTRWANVIEQMSGRSIMDIIGGEATQAISGMSALLSEIIAKLNALSESASASETGVKQAIDNGVEAARQTQEFVGQVNPSALEGTLQLLQTLVRESSTFGDEMSGMKNYALEILDIIEKISNADAGKLSSIADALVALNNISGRGGIGATHSGRGGSNLNAIAKFILQVDSAQNIGNIRLLDGVDLQGFNNIKASKTLDHLANFIAAVSGKDLSGIGGLHEALKSFEDIKISGNFGKLAAAVSELSKIVTGKKFDNLKSLDLKKAFDLSGMEGSVTTLQGLAESAEKYAEALKTIAALQKNVDKLTAGASGTAIGERLVEIENAKAQLERMYDPSLYQSQMDAMWAANERVAESYDARGEAAKRAAAVEAHVSSSWSSTEQGVTVLAQIEQSYEAVAASAMDAAQAEEAAVAAATAKELAAWDKEEDARYIKERAAAFKELTKATEEARKAEVEQAKYTGESTERTESLKEYVRLTKERLEAAKKKAEVYREDADAADLLAETEAKLAAIEVKYSSELDRVLGQREREEEALKSGGLNAYLSMLERVESKLTSTRNTYDSFAHELGAEVGVVKNLQAALNELGSFREDISGRENQTISPEDVTEYLRLKEAVAGARDALTEYYLQMKAAGKTTGQLEKASAAVGTISSYWVKAQKAYEKYASSIGGDDRSKDYLEGLRKYQEALLALDKKAIGGEYGPADATKFTALKGQVDATIAALDVLETKMTKEGSSSIAFEQKQNAFREISKAIEDASRDVEEWNKKLGEGNEFSARAEAVIGSLKDIQTALDGGGVFTAELRKELDGLDVTFRKIEADAAQVISSGMFVEGTTDWANALSKLDAAISDLDKKLVRMSAAKTGKAAGDYQELMRVRGAYVELRNGVYECTTSKEQYKTVTAGLAAKEREHTNAIQMAGEATKSFSEKIVDVASKLTSWISPMRIVMYVIRTIRQMVSTSIELDSAMTQLRVVTKASSDEMEKFGEATAKTAAEIGASIKDLIDSTTVFARLGYSMDESSLLAKYTAMLKKVGDIDIDDAQNAVTAITKAFSEEINVGDIESVMDKLVEVGNHFPISVSQLATGMNNASSILAAAGNTFEQSVALMTAANAVVQDAAKAATGLRTIAARLRNTKTELDELGEDMTEAKYEELVQKLTHLNVSLVDMNGNYRSTYDIMSDIAAKWGDLNSMEQAALATALAGTRQQAIFYSIIEQFDEASNAMDTMAESAGAMSVAYGEYLDSTQAHIDQFTAKFQNVGKTLLSSDEMSEIVDFGSAIMDVVLMAVKLINMLGGVRNAILGVVAAVAVIKAVGVAKDLERTARNLEDIKLGLIEQVAETEELASADQYLALSIGELSAAEKEELLTKLKSEVVIGNITEEQYKQIVSTYGLAAANNALDAANKKVAISLKSVWSSMSLLGKASVILSAISFAITIAQVTGLTDAFKNLFKSTDTKIEETKQKISELKQEINDITSDFRSLKESADEVIPRFAKLSEGVDKFGNNVSLTDDEYKEFLRLNNKIAEMFPQLNMGMDENGNAMLALSGDADTLTESLQRLVEEQHKLANKELASKLGEQLSLTADQVENYEKKVAGLNNSASVVKQAFGQLKNAFREDKQTFEVSGAFNQNSIDTLKELFDSFGTEYSLRYGMDGTQWFTVDLTNVGKAQFDDIEKKYNNFLAGIERETGSYARRIENEWRGVAPSLVAAVQDSIAFDGLDDQMKKVAIGLIKDLDIGDLYKRGYKTSEELTKYVVKNIIDPIYDAAPGVRDAFNEIIASATDFKLGKINEQSLRDYVASVFSGLEDPSVLTEWLNAIGIKGESTDKIIDSLVESFKAVSGSSGDAASGVKKLDEVMSETKTAFDALSKAQKDMESADYGGGLSPDTIESLAKITDKYIDYLYEENGVIKLNVDAWKEYAASALEARKEAKLSELEEARGNLGSLQNKAITEGTSEQLEIDISDALSNVQRLEKEVAVLQSVIDTYNANSTINLYGAQEAIRSLDKLKGGFDMLSKLYDGIRDKDTDIDFSIISSDEFRNTFSKLGEAYYDFIDIISKSPDDMEACQKAFDDLVNAYLAGSGALEGLTEEEKKFTTALLEQYGVVNASEVVNAMIALEKEAATFSTLGKEQIFAPGSVQASLQSIEKLKDGFEMLSKLYDSIKDSSKDLDFSILVSDDFVRTFSEYGTAYTDFIETIAASPNDIKACQDAFDNLATEYLLNSDVLVNLTEDTKASTTAMLEQYGVANAEVIVEAQLALQKEILAAASKDNANSMLAEIANSKTLAEASEEVRVILARTAIEKLNANKATIKTSADIKNLEDLASAANATNETIQRLAKIKALLEEMDSIKPGNGMTGQQRAAELTRIQDEINALLAQGIQYTPVHFGGGGASYTGGYGGSGSSGSSGGSGSGSSSSDKPQTWFEQQYAEHNHLLNMEQESVEDYLDWLEDAYQRAYAQGIIDLDDYWRYEEEVFRRRRELAEEALGGSNWFEQQYAEHNHLLNMDQESLSDYLTWFSSAYRRAYAEGLITVEEFWKYQEEELNKQRDLVKDYISDLNFQIDQLNREPAQTRDINRITSLYDAEITRLQRELRAARNAGLTDDDEYVQELLQMLDDARDGWISARQSWFSDLTGDIEHQIYLLSDKPAQRRNIDQIVSYYRDIMTAAGNEARLARERGLDENDEYVQELQRQYREARDAIVAARTEWFSDIMGDRRFNIDEMARFDTDSNRLVNAWRNTIAKIQDEIRWYLNNGYDITDEVVQNLINDLRDAEDQIIAIANSAVDGIQDVYSTLTDAAKEWATTGYLSVDSYQAILELGPKYLSFLYDENGMLKINEEALQKVLAAKTEQLAIDQAMVYAKEVLAAAEKNEVNTLQALTQVNYLGAASTWDLVYATLGLARSVGAANGISEEYFDNAENYIDMLRQLSITTITSIGEAYETLNNGYITQADALDEIISYTKELIKWENEQHIEALQNEIDAYKEIIDAKKESLRLSKEQDDHDKSVQESVEEIAKLQAKIDQLALDDSREAAAQRAKLEEELAEKQKAFAESQEDYAYNQQIEALDNEYEAFEEEKQGEIDLLKEMFRSEEALYNAALERITNGWDTLYQNLINWNTNYGNTLNDTITNAWNQAAAAVQRYGSFLDALEGVQSHTDLGPSETKGDVVLNKMRQNALAWFTTDKTGRAALHAENAALAEEFYKATGEKLHFENNSWFTEQGERIFNFTKDEIARYIVEVMKANSAAWKSADAEKRKSLSQANDMLAERLSKLLGESITKQGGVWYIGGKKLYDVYHKGGIVGGATSLKQNEVLAVLEKGEAILDKRREEGLYKIVDFIQLLSDKLGTAIDMSRLSPIGAFAPGVRIGAHYNDVPYAIGTANIHNEISVQINHNGKITEADAARFGRQIADTTISRINDAFAKRGVSGFGASATRQ